MANRTNIRAASRKKRQVRVRARVKGTGERPRLSIYRSNRHLYAQVINDREGKTLAAASTRSPEFLAGEGKKSGKAGAMALGELVARRALAGGVEQVVFDRNGFIFKKDGLVATLAEGARKGGLKF